MSEPDLTDGDPLDLPLDVASLDGLLDTLEAMLDTAAAPVCELTVDLGGTIITGHVGPTLVALTGPVIADRVEFTASPTTQLPGLLAELVDLGPRRFYPPVEAVELGADQVDALQAGQPGIIADVDGTPPLLWTVSVTWGAGRSRVVEMLDSGSRLWALSRLPDARTRLDPVSPTQVFRQLSGLLPTDDEMASAQ